MRRFGARLARLTLCSVAILPAAAAVAAAEPPALTVNAPIFPSFDPAISDYGARCDGGPVTFAWSLSNGAKIAVNGGVARTSGGTTLTLTEGQSFSWKLTRKVGSRTVTSSHFARCVPPDMNLPMAISSGTPSAGLYLMSTGTVPTLDQDLKPITTWYPTLFDPNGVPIWWLKRGFVQLNPTFLDAKTIALWVPLGHPNPLGDFGFGRWQTYSLTDKPKTTITTPDPGYDIHELQPGSSKGTYLTVTYRKYGPYDLSAMSGPPSAWGYRAVAQEVTADGHVKWQWDAHSHISTSELSQWWSTYQGARNVPVDGLPAFDLDHISSARLDGSGVILAFRHLDAVYRVSKATGRILWKLGGTTTPQSLKVIGDPNGDYPIGAPHDAFPMSGGRIGLIDIALGQSHGPRLVIYKVDPTRKTATFVSQIESPTNLPRPICCGSARQLKSGNWAISWPGQNTTGEYRPNGTPVLEFKLPPMKFSYRMQAFEKGAIPIATLRAAMDTMHPRAAGQQSTN